MHAFSKKCPLPEHLLRKQDALNGERAVNQLKKWILTSTQWRRSCVHVFPRIPDEVYRNYMMVLCEGENANFSMLFHEWLTNMNSHMVISIFQSRHVTETITCWCQFFEVSMWPVEVFAWRCRWANATSNTRMKNAWPENYGGTYTLLSRTYRFIQRSLGWTKCQDHWRSLLGKEVRMPVTGKCWW